MKNQVIHYDEIKTTLQLLSIKLPTKIHAKLISVLGEHEFIVLPINRISIQALRMFLKNYDSKGFLFHNKTVLPILHGPCGICPKIKCYNDIKFAGRDAYEYRDYIVFTKNGQIVDLNIETVYVYPKDNKYIGITITHNINLVNGSKTIDICNLLFSQELIDQIRMLNSDKVMYV